jgi:CRISPR-associated Csx10 family RAMP protein
MFNETNDFIPASALRGTLASAICMKSPKWQCEQCSLRSPTTSSYGDVKSECNFDKIFIDGGKIRFEHLYPLRYDSYAEEGRVFPATAVSCKRKPGILTEFLYKPYKEKETRKVYDKPPHGVFDILIPQFAYQLLNNYGYDFKCPECKSKVEPFSGFYNFVPTNELASQSFFAKETKYRTAIVKSSSPKRRLVRTAINRYSRTAEEGLLFSLEVVEEISYFYSTVTVEQDDLAPIIQTELKKLKNRRFGGVRSRGLGEIGSAYYINFVDFDSELRERVETFNHFLKGYLKKLSPDAECADAYFTINLQSDAILRNERGEQAAVINEDLLKTQLQSLQPGLSLDGLKLVKWVTSQSLYSGWSDAWKLPKNVGSAIGSGSVFVFKVDALTDELISALEQLQVWGIGERCEEGYGRLIICDPFHWGFQDKEKDYDENWRY